MRRNCAFCFLVQVGGHTKFLWIGDGLICKPLIEREAMFYQARVRALRPFMPRFEGKLRVKRPAG